MEIFVWSVDFFASQHDVTRQLAQHLHSPPYTTNIPLNFRVDMFKAKKGSGRAHKGYGALTLPTEEVGRMFLQQFGQPSPRSFIKVRGRTVSFKLSDRTASRDIVIGLQTSHYLDPAILEERERVNQVLSANSVSVQRLQFGRECRDHVFSIEWDCLCDASSCLVFDAESRQLCIRIKKPPLFDPEDGPVEDEDEYKESTEVVIQFSNIDYITCTDSRLSPVILIFLLDPPQFIQRPPVMVLYDSPSKRYPALQLEDVHGRRHADVSQYVSTTIRLVCSSQKDLGSFRQLATEAKLNLPIHNDVYHAAHRGLFSESSLEELSSWLRELDFQAAFQIERLVNDGSVDPKEILQLKGEVNAVVRAAKQRGSRSTDYISMVFRDFGVKALDLFWSTGKHQTLKECLLKIKRQHDRASSPLITSREDDGIFLCMHVQITPTGIFFSGPMPERSNRVIRQYRAENHRKFLRVSFLDEGKLQLQFGRDVDGTDFIQRRIKPFFDDGLKVAGRKFRFLGYSQSALKEHAVYFMTPFMENGRLVTTKSVIASLGSFSGLPFDSRLMYCPARYAARISQGFTSTDPTTTEIENVVLDLPDIVSVDSKGHKWVHTDGCGTMSPEVAQSVHSERQSGRKGRRRPLREYGRALQIRLQGAKGVLSVDHRLTGQVVCLRPSMVKFLGRQANKIEVAKVFDKPGPLYLNRPLIMLLEGLGVPYESFKKFQDQAVQYAEDSTQSFDRAAHFLQGAGLGTSFRIPSVLNSLTKLGVFAFQDESFYQKIMEYGKNHALRLLKHRARIPVPGAYNLVGIADIHKELPPKHIFACIRTVDNWANPIYLEGPVLVSRSPTIHPGDVQIVTAIGPPAPGSCFEIDDLANTLVFSTTDERPLPSCLGGGDLDGDEYNIVPLNTLPEFWIDRTRIQVPGEYPQAKRKELDRPCTMADVADFVMEYITSDVLGMVSINWRILADQTDIFNPNCMKMAELHSLAVDYPKSGNPVPIGEIPKRKNTLLPDWYAPETMYTLDETKYYKSQKAIGKLFRGIKLSAPQLVAQLGREQRQKMRDEEYYEEDIDELVDMFQGFASFDDDPVWVAVSERVSDYIDVDNTIEDDVQDEIKSLFQGYKSDLSSICSAHTLSSGRTAMLTEEEAVIGTIVANTSQPRKRLDHIGKMREQTDTLVRDVRSSLEGDDNLSSGESLERAFFAWRLANRLCHQQSSPVGARSFWWVTLGAVFEAVKEIEEEEKNELRRQARSSRRANALYN
ncbi:RdRP-domain-containing protein [Dendrothele bispora CBS 962.96]|uniref:RNA-dependent RNA polymerase n=1 Tax=Dendrothele bispora (strain CBS 962.96) TaxID=1314807 RepID=A0A4S8KVM2_DENBC|nr:RdRP-domain-containing protein [Dendrothele bispora CBS 962.96]